MSPELDRALCERYRRIFADRCADGAESAMYRGFECEDGWYVLIDALCAALQRETDEYGGPQLVALQVKEKFGCLRFRVRNPSDRQHALIDFAGALSERICEICGAPALARAHGEIWENVRCKQHRAS